MKNTIFRIALVTCLLITSLFWGGAVFAQDDDDGLPDPGLTPDSPFYFLDKWGKSISLMFTFSAQERARKALQFAEERLAEAEIMATANRTREMIRATDDYDAFMARVNERAEEVARQGLSDDISERLALAAARHLSILDRLKERASEQAGEVLNRARIATLNRQKNALRAMSADRLEKALQINAEAIQKRLEWARMKAAENADAAGEALEEAAELAEIEEEIKGKAMELGLDVPAIEERLAWSTSNRFDVLTEVYASVPETARPTIASALENSVSKYGTVIERLEERNVSAVTVNTERLEQTREQLTERIMSTISSAEPVSDNTDSQEQPLVRVRVDEDGGRVQGRINIVGSESGQAATDNTTENDLS